MRRASPLCPFFENIVKWQELLLDTHADKRRRVRLRVQVIQTVGHVATCTGIVFWRIPGLACKIFGAAKLVPNYVLRL